MNTQLTCRITQRADPVNYGLRDHSSSAGAAGVAPVALVSSAAVPPSPEPLWEGSPPAVPSVVLPPAAVPPGAGLGAGAGVVPLPVVPPGVLLPEELPPPVVDSPAGGPPVLPLGAAAAPPVVVPPVLPVVEPVEVPVEVLGALGVVITGVPVPPEAPPGVPLVGSS